jgi:uncharacterized protein YwqG
MNIDNLLKTIEASKISEHKEFVTQAVRPAINIIKKDNAKPVLGSSRFGGNPDLPVGTKWPMYESLPYKFIGQINFSEIPFSNNELPSTGLLCLFVSYAPDGDDPIFWNNDGYIKAIFIPELTNLETVSPPPNFGLDKRNQHVVALEFQATVDLPFDYEQVIEWPFDDEETEVYNEIRSTLHGEDYLLGYPSHCSLGYNPTPGTEWVSLLTVNSDDDLRWYWHDGDKLMVFIENEKLKKSDFSYLKSDAG